MDTKKILEQLVIANKELACQNEEKAKRAAELVIVNNELNQLLRFNSNKDRLISILGHDLKSPFISILRLSEILIDEIDGFNKADIKDIAKDIHKSAQITNNLLEDILSWANPEQSKLPFSPQNLSFEIICNDTVEVLRPSSTAKNITINYSTTDNLNVFADAYMLKAVIINLVSNAIKFTETGGVINIGAEVNSGNVTISVSDTGIGIPPDGLAKLFKISEIPTTKGIANETGTGMGLLLCKEFVKKHGGRIWAESEVGKGSKFKFTLPLNAEPYEVSVAKNIAISDEADSQVKSLKILITDDDEVSRKFLGISVKMFSKEILYAQNGFEAVKTFRNNPDIDLILMDIKMPDLNGYEATRQIRKISKKAIIIAQTAFAEPSDIEMAKEAGCSDFIAKPIHKTSLQELIKKHCSKY